MPSVSVIMPVYNAARFLREGVESILNQTFTDFEFLIFDDGSTDESPSILQSFDDPRIKLTISAENRGYVHWLNEGIAMAKGRYVARMDADDVSAKTRLEKQVQFLEKNPYYVLCGTNYEMFPEGGVSSLPETDESIKIGLLSITPFCHPSVMFRREILEENGLAYSVQHMPAEDKELWGRLAPFGKYANLKEVLLRYRVHDQNMSYKPRTPGQQKIIDQATVDYTKWFFSNHDLSAIDLEKLVTLFNQRSPFTLGQLQETAPVVMMIAKSSAAFPVGRQVALDAVLQRYFYCCTISSGIGLPAFVLGRKVSGDVVSFALQVRLFVKCLFRFQKKI